MIVLLNENGYVESYALVGSLVDGIEVPDPEDIEHFESHFEAYGYADGKVSFNDVWQTMLEKSRKGSREPSAQRAGVLACYQSCAALV